MAEHEVDLRGGEAVARLAARLLAVDEPGRDDLAAELGDALLDAPLVALDALLEPVELRPVCGQAAAALVAGRITGKEGEKFEAGRLGEYTIGANGEIVLGPLTTFDADNIDDFDF